MKGVATVWVLSMCLTLVSTAAGAQEILLDKSPAQVYFSPGGGGADAIVREIGNARKEVLVQAYALSAQTIVKALLDAQARGGAVRVILDKSEVTEGLSPSVLLSNAGASVYMDGKHGLAHSHIIVIDRRTVVTGSYSFTKAAEEQNAEDLIIIRSQPLAELYRENWERHRSHSSKQ